MSGLKIVPFSSTLSVAVQSKAGNLDDLEVVSVGVVIAGNNLFDQVLVRHPVLVAASEVGSVATEVADSAIEVVGLAIVEVLVAEEESDIKEVEDLEAEVGIQMVPLHPMHQAALVEDVVGSAVNQMDL